MIGSSVVFQNIEAATLGSSFSPLSVMPGAPHATAHATRRLSQRQAWRRSQYAGSDTKISLSVAFGS